MFDGGKFSWDNSIFLGVTWDMADSSMIFMDFVSMDIEYVNNFYFNGYVEYP